MKRASMAATSEPTDLGIKIFVVNLESSSQRLDRMTDQLSSAGIEFQRVPAVDGRAAAAESFSEYDGKLALRRYGRPMSGPEVGCFLSHRRSAEQFLSTDEEFALVLEDDTYMPDEFLAILMQLSNVLRSNDPGSWDIINLGNPPKKYARPWTEIRHGLDTFSLCRSFYFPLGTFALIWNRSGAEEFLRQSERVYAPVDQFIRDWCAATGRGLALAPSLVGVDRSQSDIRPRLSDRLKLNLIRYWTIKNLRLLKNHRQAKQSMRVASEAA
jgi:glycosyl transferase, family 25